MESGEYFLKASDKEAKEIERRKQKVCTSDFFMAVTDFLFSLSKLKLQKRDKPSVQKLSLRLLKLLHQLLKRNGGTANGRLVILKVGKNLGRRLGRKRRRRDVKIRMLKRKMNHDDDGCSRQILCVVLAFYFNTIMVFSGCQIV